MATTHPQFPSLQVTKEVDYTMSKDLSLHPKVKSKMLGFMGRLDTYGTRDKKMLGQRYEHVKGCWHVFKYRKGSDEWRLMFLKIPNSTQYGLVSLYRKDTQEIDDRVWKRCERIAKREGWL